MKKKGFTLIELLAVIVILAVIALIATPAVLGIIEDSKKSAAEASARNIASAAKAYYMSNLMNNISTGSIDLSNSSFKYDGEQATKGYITYDAKGNVTGKMYVSGYCIEITESNTTSTKMDESECTIENIPSTPDTPDTKVAKTWTINEEPTLIDLSADISYTYVYGGETYQDDSFNINITNFSKMGSYIETSCDVVPECMLYAENSKMRVGWISDSARTLTFLTEPSGELLEWLKANAVAVK